MDHKNVIEKENYTYGLLYTHLQHEAFLIDRLFLPAFLEKILSKIISTNDKNPWVICETFIRFESS